MAAQKKKFPAQEIINGCAEKKIGCAAILKRLRSRFFLSGCCSCSVGQLPNGKQSRNTKGKKGGGGVAA
jgi:hypothetical protein